MPKISKYKKHELTLTGHEKVEKRNVLNEVKNNDMTLQELRLFCIYLAKINPRDISTRYVRFSLSDFQEIMGLGRLNIEQFEETADSLLKKTIKIPLNTGGRHIFQLFSECTVTEDGTGEWYVEINAHDHALPLMFDFKKNYFTYELCNILRLKSVNQIRMYEILKQYEYAGQREISVEELKELLGIKANEQTRWERFRTKVLDSCQKALAENTDILFEYERGKTGNGGKWLTIIFTIKQNPKFAENAEATAKSHSELATKKQLIEATVEEVTPKNKSPKSPKIKNSETTLPPELLEELSAACNHEFKDTQLEEIYQQISAFVVEKGRVPYLRAKYLNMQRYAERTVISNPFRYICQMITNDFHGHQQEIQQNQASDSYGATYDINEYESHSVVDEEEYKPKESYRAAYDIAEFEREKGDEEEW